MMEKLAIAPKPVATIGFFLLFIRSEIQPKTRGCWILSIQIGESAEQALQRHARDPEHAGHAFVMLPTKRGLDEEMSP